MKNAQNVKNELNVWLRWTNGGGDEGGNTWPYRFWLEDWTTHEEIALNEEAVELIKKRTTNAYRDGSNIYTNYLELLACIDFPGVLKKLRGDRSIKKITEMLEIPYTSYQKWELGERTPMPYIRRKLIEDLLK